MEVHFSQISSRLSDDERIHALEVQIHALEIQCMGLESRYDLLVYEMTENCQLIRMAHESMISFADEFIKMLKDFQKTQDEKKGI